MGKRSCEKERLAKLEMIAEKDRGHCFMREEGNASRGGNVRDSDDRSLDTF